MSESKFFALLSVFTIVGSFLIMGIILPLTKILIPLVLISFFWVGVMFSAFALTKEK